MPTVMESFLTLQKADDGHHFTGVFIRMTLEQQQAHELPALC